MFAATVVTITEDDFPWGDLSFTKDGVTVSADNIDPMAGNLIGGGSFSTTLGNFTKIEVNTYFVTVSGEGWSGDMNKKTWTGNASSVSFSGDIMGMGNGVTIMFTIEEPEPELEETITAITVNGVALDADQIALINDRQEDYGVFHTQAYATAPTVVFSKHTVITYGDASTMVTDEDIEVVAEYFNVEYVGVFWRAALVCTGKTFRVDMGVTAPATPVISGEDEFSESTTVTLSCETAGVSIFYTLDGSDPASPGAIEYTAPFSLYESATVKAVAVGAQTSTVATKTFTKTEPEPTGGLNIVELTPIPASWADDESIFLTPEDLPGFKEVTLEEAMTWTTEYTDDAILFYGFSDVGRAMYVNYYHGEKYHGSSYYYRYTVSWNARVYYTTGGGAPEPIPATYTLQLVADPEKGSVAVTNLLGSNIVDNGNGNYTVPENAEVTILATPNEGYEFAGWKVGNIDDMVGCYYCGTALNTKDNPMTITMTEDKAYLAEFAATASEDVDITPNEDPDHAGVYYSTFFDSANKYVLPDGVEAYIVTTLSDDVMQLQKVADAGQTIPAGAGVILKASVTPFTLTPSDDEAVSVEGNRLDGSDVSIATPANCYVLAGEDGVGFYHYTASMLNPHKAYIIYAPNSGNQAPRRLRFAFETATGVEEITNDQLQITNKVIENGVLYIIKNGVKFNAMGQEVK